MLQGTRTFLGLKSITALLLMSLQWRSLPSTAQTVDTEPGTPLTSSKSSSSPSSSPSLSYIFLQKFPLENTNNWIFHTEVLVCSRDGFRPSDQEYLDELIHKYHFDDPDSNGDNGDNGRVGYVEIPESWWRDKSAAVCTELGYGGAACAERCCGVPYGPPQRSFPLNERRAVIGNADTSQKSLYLYGSNQKSGHISVQDAYEHILCNPNPDTPKCWSNWSGVDYNPITNNCNTFTSTVLHCIYQLSEQKPNLGPSDMVTVKCDQCPQHTTITNPKQHSNQQQQQSPDPEPTTTNTGTARQE